MSELLRARGGATSVRLGRAEALPARVLASRLARHTRSRMRVRACLTTGDLTAQHEAVPCCAQMPRSQRRRPNSLPEKIGGSVRAGAARPASLMKKTNIWVA